MKKNFSSSFLAAAQKAMFNSSEWKPVKDEDGNEVKYTLEEIWEVTNPGLYKEIAGDTAEVTATEFNDGQIGLRITIPFKDGSTVELKLSGKSALEEGDKVKISSITGQELKKAGQDNILRYDAEKAE